MSPPSADLQPEIHLEITVARGSAAESKEPRQNACLGGKIGKFVETGLESLGRRLERVEESLAELREFVAYERGRVAGSLSPTEGASRAAEAGR